MSETEARTFVEGLQTCSEELSVLGASLNGGGEARGHVADAPIDDQDALSERAALGTDPLVLDPWRAVPVIGNGDNLALRSQQRCELWVHAFEVEDLLHSENLPSFDVAGEEQGKRKPLDFVVRAETSASLSWLRVPSKVRASTTDGGEVGKPATGLPSVVHLGLDRGHAPAGDFMRLERPSIQLQFTERSRDAVPIED